MPLGGLLPYNNQIDFNQQAGLLAGPMPALPQFDFQPITVNGGGGAVASPAEVGSQNQPGNPNSPHTPGSAGPAGNGSPTGNLNMMNLRNAHNFANQPLNVPYIPQGGDSNFGGGSWSDAGNGAMLGGLLGPAGMLAGAGLGWMFGGEGDAPRPEQDPFEPSSGDRNAPVQGLMPTTSRPGSNTGITPAQAVAAYDNATGGGGIKDTELWRHLRRD